jgi:hypothetical protein
MADFAPDHADSAKPDDGAARAPGQDIAARYWREIERYDKAMGSWEQVGKRIVRKYRSEDRMMAGSEKSTTARRFALLWSNVETLKPAIYAKLPTAVVSRRFKDEDPIGRIGAELLERSANCMADLYAYDETFRMVRDDRLLPGRGQAWVRYEATMEDVPANGEEGQEGYEEGYSRLADGPYGGKAEKVCVDHVHWCDFGHNVAKVWSEVWLVWRKVLWTKAKVRERFGSEIAGKLAYDVKPPENDERDQSGERLACLYEAWDKRRAKTCFLAKQYDGLIEDGPPPLKVHGFFPCPEPAYGSKTSDSLRPTPDYVYYQDQAEEIDDLTAKIAELTDWLIVKGFIPGGPSSEGTDAIERLLREKGKQILVPIESWSSWTDRGGSRQIDWLPLDIIIQALKSAIEARQQLIQDVYQITGVADILRGQTDPQETLGAQQLKAQTGSRRVRNTKDEIARHARDVYRLVCEVIAENFHPETLQAMTGYKYVPGRVLGTPQQQAVPMLPSPGMGRPSPMLGSAPPMQGLRSGPPVQPPPVLQNGGQPLGQPAPQPVVPPMLGQPVPGSQGAPMLPPPQPAMPDTNPMIFDDQVIERLRNDRVRSYSIDIETDSTVQPDEDAEKQRRTEFATMFGGMLKSASELMQMGPLAVPLVPMVGEALKFTVRGFRAGRQLEDVIDRALDQMLLQIKQMASQPPKPSPEDMKLQADAKAQQAKLQSDTQARQAELQFREREAQLTAQIEQAKAQQQVQIEQMKAQITAQIEEMKAKHEADLKERELAHTMRLQESEMASKAALQEQEFQHRTRMEEASAQREAENAAYSRQIAEQDAQYKRASADREFEHKRLLADRDHELARTSADRAHEIAMRKATNGAGASASA